MFGDNQDASHVGVNGRMDSGRPQLGHDERLFAAVARQLVGRAEIIAIERTFPELALPKRRKALRKSLTKATTRARTMSAATRKVVSERMKSTGLNVGKRRQGSSELTWLFTKRRRLILAQR